MKHSIDEGGWGKEKRRIGVKEDGGDGGLGGGECCSAHNGRAS